MRKSFISASMNVLVPTLFARRDDMLGELDKSRFMFSSSAIPRLVTSSLMI